MRARLVLLALAVALGSEAARAHGPPLGVAAVLTWIGDARRDIAARPAIVRLWRGLAHLEGDGVMRYLCPARWGDAPTPLVAPLGDAVVVASELGLFLVAADGRVSPLAAPALAGQRLRAIAGDGAEVAGLTRAGALVRIAPGEPAIVTTASPAPDDLIVLGPDRWIIATEDQGRLMLAHVDGDGAVTPLLEAPYRATPSLARAVVGEVEHLFVRGMTSDGYRLDRVERDPVGGAASLTRIATSAEPISGPVAAGDTLLVVLGGQPHRLDGGMASALAATPRLFCVQRAPGGGALVCAGTDLLAYDPVAGLGEALLMLARLRPPSLEGLDDAAALGCRADWMDAAADAGLAPELVRPAEWFAPAEAERTPEAGAERVEHDTSEPGASEGGAAAGASSGCAGGAGSALAALGCLGYALGRRCGAQAA